ncbi:hypothetical protein [Rubripirellula obstinata]|nr:hypothetical protein [Rubripirellula obstinata]
MLRPDRLPKSIEQIDHQIDHPVVCFAASGKPASDETNCGDH